VRVLAPVLVPVFVFGRVAVRVATCVRRLAERLARKVRAITVRPALVWPLTLSGLLPWARARPRVVPARVGRVVALASERIPLRALFLVRRIRRPRAPFVVTIVVARRPAALVRITGVGVARAERRRWVG